MKIALNTLESEYISKYPEEAIVKTKDLDDKSKAKSKKESKKESKGKNKKGEADTEDSGSETSKSTSKREPTAWNIFTTMVTAIVKKSLDGEKMPAGLHLRVAGYLKESGNMDPSETDVIVAMKYLLEHPDHLSIHQKKKAEDAKKKEEKNAA